MISARHWRERRAFWHALVFWAWLASFVFGFAASDLFHTATCPDQLALHSAAQPTGSQFSAPHALSVDVECASSLLQLIGQSVLVATALWVLPLMAMLVAARLLPIHALSRALVCVARGPPVPVF